MAPVETTDAATVDQRCSFKHRQGGDTIIQTQFCVSPCAWVKLIFSVSQIKRVNLCTGAMLTSSYDSICACHLAVYSCTKFALCRSLDPRIPVRCADSGRIIHDSATNQQMHLGLAGACERILKTLKATRCRTRPPLADGSISCRRKNPPLWATQLLLARGHIIHGFLQSEAPLDSHAGKVQQHHQRDMDEADTQMSRQVRGDAGVFLRYVISLCGNWPL